MLWREGNVFNIVIIKCNNEKIYMYIFINNVIVRLDEWKLFDFNLEIVNVSNNVVFVIVLFLIRSVCLNCIYYMKLWL